MKANSPKLVALALAVSFCGIGHASEDELDINSKFRAKIAKEKVKQAAQQRSAQEKGAAAADTKCGSQSIGNIDTNGRIGAAPREVFVFAPNAVNIVSGSGCR
jgi:hypothetical protein